MGRRNDNREWHWASEVPAEIQGERRELLEMVFAHTSRKGASWAGPSPRTWRFTFPDSGGWSSVVDLRQDQITPMRVAEILSGEAFAADRLNREVMEVLRRIAPVEAGFR